MPYLRLAAALLLVAPLALGAQQPGTPPKPPADSTCVAAADSTGGAPRCVPAPLPAPEPVFPLRPRLAPERLRLERPAPLSPLGSMRLERRPAVRVAGAQADSLRREALRRAEEAFRAGSGERLGWAPRAPADVTAVAARSDSLAIRAAADSAAGPPVPGAAQAAANRAMDIFGDYADLGLVLNSRLETKVERNKNERCTTNELLNPAFNCAGSLQPQFDFQFNVRTGGIVADRIHVNVDYDSQREFDASNNINVFYEGKSDELIERLEVGNVFFSPPSSRFITGGIPSGNYGLQAKGQVGPMRFSTIVAQQKGNRVNGRAFDVGGDGTLQEVVTDLEDFRFESRRFFWVVDPAKFGSLFPDIDILNGSQLRAAREALPSTQRPAQVRIYRWRADAPLVNPNAPRFRLLDAPAAVPPEAGVPYELLIPGQDYYLDPSQLWFVLVRPVANNERVVLAYTPESGAPDPNVTGTPDTEVTGQDQSALLIYSSEARSTDVVFRKEIRSVYRIGGEDLRRETVSLRVGTQAGGGQEVPTGGTAQTYLQMLGLAQSTNSAVFDVENRLWPRPGDPVQAVGGNGRSLFRDRYLVFPSLQPFAGTDKGGRIQPGNVANDTIYRLEATDFATQRRPPARYFMRAVFQAAGGGDFGSLMLGSVQISRNSERLLLDGVPLRRDIDYEVDYELGRVTFLRPDTLFRVRRRVNVQYEENPLFAAAPTTIFGLASQLPFQNGQLNFVAISQNQRTTFNRPPLGFEPASSLVAGVNGNFTFDAAPISRLFERIPTVGTVGASSITIGGEIATSRPQPNAAGVAYVESFEGEGGIPVPLAEGAWYFGSIPTPLADSTIEARAGGAGRFTNAILDTARAATLAWQNTGVIPSTTTQTLISFNIQQIDPQVRLAGRAPLSPEQVLWLSLYPANTGGVFTGAGYNWRFDGQDEARRWRSIRTVLSPTGIDMSRAEYLEFWALVDPSASGGDGKNPLLIFDFGDVSENSLAFVPDSLVISGVDTTLLGRRTSGAGRLDTERDSLTNQFDVTNDDVGLASDVAEDIVVNQAGGDRVVVPRLEVCRVKLNFAFFLGDNSANCTVGNNRLDEEDINLDRSLFNPDRTDLLSGEQVVRWVVDLNDRTLWSRPGGAFVGARERSDGTRESVNLQWQLIRIPINKPDDKVGDPVLRRIRSLRVTMVSGTSTDPSEMTQTALARLRLVGSPWLKRQERVLRTLVGEDGTRAAPGTFQIAGIIGTQDSSGAISYQPPPGVVDAPESRQTGLENSTIQINERSIRILAGGATDIAGESGQGIPLNHRAEAYFRFPEGQKNFMGYRELRVWARGRGKGWAGPGGSNELEFFIKIGRDADNFYLYRRPVLTGETQAAWTDVAVQFQHFYRLRTDVQNQFLQGAGSASLACTPADSALLGIDSTSMSVEPGFAACSRDAAGGTYMLFTRSPNNSAPNLAQVQDLAVGMARVRVDGGEITASDTLEVWADDIRLTGVVDDVGYAGDLTLAINAGDVFRFALSGSRKDANFRQLAENPSYVSDGALALSTSFQLDRFLPGAGGWSMPVNFSHGRSGQDPYFLAQQDLLGGEIRGLRTPQSTSSRYGMSLRRTAPTGLPVVGALIDNLALDANFATANAEGNYNKSDTRAFDVNASYAVQARARSWALPGFVAAMIDRLPGFMRSSEAARSLRAARLRWSPTNVRFTSALGKSESNNTNFLKPAEAAGDTGRLVTSLSHLWRNTAGFEVRPFGALAATWNFNSLRDLRRYDDEDVPGSVNAGIVAAGEREKLLGMDVGLERERQMNAGISFQPVVTQWLRPRVEYSSNFSYQRDPNTRQLIRDTVFAFDDTTRGELRLPRRLNNSQVFNAGTALDLGRMFLGSQTNAVRLPRWRRILSDAIEPIDFSFTRTLSSAFDGTPFTPGLGYQFGLGGIDDFLAQRGRKASSASTNNTAQVRSAISLPLGFTAQQEIRRTYDRTFYRTSDNDQLFRENETLVLPRLALGWNYRPLQKWVARVITSIGANAGWEPSETRGFAPSITGDSALAERSLTEIRAIPVRASVTWAFLGDVTTTASYRKQESEEQRPGARVLGEGSDVSAQLSRVFALPKSWNLSDQVMTSFSWQQTSTRRYLPNATGGVAANQAFNGRTAFNFNADTQLAENLLGSLVVSRVVNYDNLTNRRFSQLVMTAVFQLSFQAGTIR